jgi:hypothetical protein
MQRIADTNGEACNDSVPPQIRCVDVSPQVEIDGIFYLNGINLFTLSLNQ